MINPQDARLMGRDAVKDLEKNEVWVASEIDRASNLLKELPGIYIVAIVLYKCLVVSRVG